MVMSLNDEKVMMILAMINTKRKVMKRERERETEREKERERKRKKEREKEREKKGQEEQAERYGVCNLFQYSTEKINKILSLIPPFLKSLILIQIMVRAKNKDDNLTVIKAL